MRNQYEIEKNAMILEKDTAENMLRGAMEMAIRDIKEEEEK